MDIQQIINNRLYPCLPEECEKLGIPRSFVNGVYGCYPKPFEYHSICTPIFDENSNITNVHIRINSEYGKSILGVLFAKMDFYHEIWHAGEYYEGKPRSQFRADVYGLKRILQEWFRGLCNIFAT